MRLFEDKVFVITGGSSGIGLAIAEHLARQGSRVVVAAIDVEDSNLVARSGFTQSLYCDVTSEKDVVNLAARVSESYGGSVDGLVNCAGTNGTCHLIENMPLSAWQHTLSLNITGTMLATREFIPLLAAGGGGSVVNIGSNVGRRGVPYRSDYVCSKWAVIGFTQTAALELADRNIRVNAVNPGPVAGDAIESILQMHAVAEKRDLNEVKRELLEATPLRRFVQPQEVADVVEFLFSAQSSSLTGQSIEASCGLIMR